MDCTKSNQKFPLNWQWKHLQLVPEIEIHLKNFVDKLKMAKLVYVDTNYMIIYSTHILSTIGHVHFTMSICIRTVGKYSLHFFFFQIGFTHAWLKKPNWTGVVHCDPVLDNCEVS